jgi:TonB-dependent SusC/RagA subfamily outer membrane receptor
VEELFEGRFPGVRVTAVPGQGIAVRIRGATSVNGSNEPLYVVDGFPLATSSDGLLALNPSDIARIEVLKDPGSTAEYGMRGANGVVLITTKRGR